MVHAGLLLGGVRPGSGIGSAGQGIR
jgi:hypothetical protein